MLTKFNGTNIWDFTDKIRQNFIGGKAILEAQDKAIAVWKSITRNQ